MRDKAISEMTEILFPLAERVIATRPDNPRAASPEEIQGVGRRTGAEIETIQDVRIAFDRAREVAAFRGCNRGNGVDLSGWPGDAVCSRQRIEPHAKGFFSRMEDVREVNSSVDQVGSEQVGRSGPEPMTVAPERRSPHAFPGRNYGWLSRLAVIPDPRSSHLAVHARDGLAGDSRWIL